MDQDEKKYDKNAAKTVLNMPPAPKLGAKKEAFWVLVSIPYSKELSSVRNLVLFLIFYHFISWAEISSIIYGFHELFACASCLRKWFAWMSTFVIFLSFMKSYDVFLQIFWFRKWFPTRFRYVIFFANGIESEIYDNEFLNKQFWQIFTDVITVYLSI